MAMETGMKFIKDQNLSPNTKLTKVFMDGEPEEFKSLFKVWQIYDMTHPTVLYLGCVNVNILGI